MDNVQSATSSKGAHERFGVNGCKDAALLSSVFVYRLTVSNDFSAQFYLMEQVTGRIL